MPVGSGGYCILGDSRYGDVYICVWNEIDGPVKCIKI